MTSYRFSHFGGPSTRAAGAWKLIRGGLGSFKTALDALVFPWSCAICGSEAPAKPICSACHQRLLAESEQASAWACPRCAMQAGPYADLSGGCAACRGHALGFDAAFALGSYEGDLRNLCLRLKHERNAWLAPWLGELVGEARGAAIRDLPRDTLIVPVPLHWWRRWERGYNQADALAHGLARRLDLRVHQSLRRVIATDRLAEKGRTERKDVMRGAFLARPGGQLAGRSILLVDDILTTGVTCGDAARALKKAGATKVVVVVVARAERKTL